MHFRSNHRRHGAGHPLAACRCALALGALLAWPVLAGAQPRPADRSDGRVPEVLDAQAAVPPVRHVSAFARYRGLGETPVASWRDANDTVTRIGGWRVYTREAHAPEAPASAPAARPLPSAPASGPGAHGHHGHHGAPSPAGARP